MNPAPLEIERRSLPVAAIIVSAIGGFVLLLGLWLLVGFVPDAIEQGDRERTIALAAIGGFFAFVGGLTIGLAVWSGRRAAQSQALRERHPDSPWLWNPAWTTGLVPGSTRFLAIMVPIFAVVWNAVSWAIVPTILGRIEDGRPGAAVALIFPLIGIPLAILAARAVQRARKYGRSELELATLPGVIGGRFEVVLHTATFFETPEGFAANLTCDRQHTSRSRTRSSQSGRGSGSSTSNMTVYEDEQSISLASFVRTATGGRVSMAFEIPEECEPTADLGPQTSIKWYLHIAAATDGVAFDTSFEVPIYRLP